jgi:hypothetical protein
MMKKILFFIGAVLVLMLCVSSIYAGDTRIKGMGYQANFYIRDSYNIWEFPSTVVQYRGMAFAESMMSEQADSNQLWSGGIHFPVTSSFVLGVYIRNSIQELEYADTQFFYGTYIDRSAVKYYPDLSGQDASHMFTLFGGYQLNNTDLGFFVSSHSSRYTVDYTVPVSEKRESFEDKLSYLTLGGGIGYKANERTRFDGSLFYSIGSFSNVETAMDTTQERQPESYYAYRVGARLFYVFSARALAVPFVQYGQNSHGYRNITKLGNIIKSSVSKDTYYTVGSALELIPRAKSLVVLAVGLRGQSWTSEVTLFSGSPPLQPKTTLLTLPFISIGLEGQLATWLEARFSFYELLNNHTIDEPNGINNGFDRTKFNGSDYSAAFGLTFHVGRFDIDTLIDKNGAADFLHNGPAFISGKDYSGDGLFSQLSITYRFQ